MAAETLSESAPAGNVPELTVSELAFSLKRTLEETYGRIRVRGELSRIKIHTSGHMYSDIKDAEAVLNLVCWKGTLARLSVKPEEGLEVICTGRISSYPARSNYQLIVDSMELAGAGALLKILEERRKKLAAEGLFAAERKKKLPFLPEVIGVITSPTGAVIRDILHRLSDRFPRRVLLWPVLVQGPGAAEQIAAAIRGFDALKSSGTIPRPDLLIVARGGGSLEDLMPFNEETVVRAAADCAIPLISAIGHETDTTLIDHAADLRAPTPTAAAEMAVPRRADLITTLNENIHRLTVGLDGQLLRNGHRLDALAARLGDPLRLMEIKTQALDHAAHKGEAAFERGLARRERSIIEAAARLRHPQAVLQDKDKDLGFVVNNLQRAGLRLWQERQKELEALVRVMENLSFRRILDRGFAVIRDAQGKALTRLEQTQTGQAVQVEFGDGITDATLGGRR